MRLYSRSSFFCASKQPRNVARPHSVLPPTKAKTHTGIRLRSPAILSRSQGYLFIRIKSPCGTNQRGFSTIVTSSVTDPYQIGTQSEAYLATLRMLEWSKLCLFVSEFASTRLGKQQCASMQVPLTQGETELLLKHTRAMNMLEYDLACSFDFGGISSEESQAAVTRANKGGICTATQLKAVVRLMSGVENMRRAVQVIVCQTSLSEKATVILPITSALSSLSLQPLLARAINEAIDDEGKIVDGASANLGAARARVRALTSRLANVLKGLPGEVSDRGGRMCLAVPPDLKVNGVVLGGASGGSLLYVEPPGVVADNNELLAARAMVESAEEAVLWDLSGKLMGVAEEVSRMVEVVTWLDTLAAKVRYGASIKGVFPEIVPWDSVFRQRGAAALKKSNKQLLAAGKGSAAKAAKPAGKEDSFDDDTEADGLRYAVRLRNLRHPLLLGEYMKAKEAHEAGDRKRVGVRRRGRSSGKRQNMMDEMSESEDDESDEEGSPEKPKLPSPIPPRAIDVLIHPQTSVVVITGPNTGGKTAAMKALGLAVMMAKCGIPIPVDAPASLPCFSSVLADIGDEQSLTASLSTFSGHLRRIQGVMAEADGKSLLLLDELGTGTDPVEGAALGMALLKKLVEGGHGCGALTIATTHHSIMTSLKFEDPRFENASVEFDDQALAPTYKLLWGIPGRSNALNIASRLGLDEHVIGAARARLDVDVTAANVSISALEDVAAQQEREEGAAWMLQQQMERLRKQYRALGQQNDKLKMDLGRQREDALLEVYKDAWGRYRKVLLKVKQLKQTQAASTDMNTLADELCGSDKPVTEPVAAPITTAATSESLQAARAAWGLGPEEEGVVEEDPLKGFAPLADVEDEVDDLFSELMAKKAEEARVAQELRLQEDEALALFEQLLQQQQRPANNAPTAPPEASTSGRSSSSSSSKDGQFRNVGDANGSNDSRGNSNNANSSSNGSNTNASSSSGTSNGNMRSNDSGISSSSNGGNSGMKRSSVEGRRNSQLGVNASRPTSRNKQSNGMLDTSRLPQAVSASTRSASVQDDEQVSLMEEVLDRLDRLSSKNASVSSNLGEGTVKGASVGGKGGFSDSANDLAKSSLKEQGVPASSSTYASVFVDADEELEDMVLERFQALQRQLSEGDGMPRNERSTEQMSEGDGMPRNERSTEQMSMKDGQLSSSRENTQSVSGSDSLEDLAVFEKALEAAQAGMDSDDTINSWLSSTDISQLIKTQQQEKERKKNKKQGSKKKKKPNAFAW